MPKLTYDEQISMHLDFLQQSGLEVELDSLVITEVNDGGIGDRKTKWTRCKGGSHKDARKQGECVYKVEISRLEENLNVVHSFCRNSGPIRAKKTFGLGPDGEQRGRIQKPETVEDLEKGHIEAAKRAYGFWQKCSPTGNSEYLSRKNVGAHGVRFHSSSMYGTSVIIPLCDASGYQWGYQAINSDGSKRFARGCKTSGLFHFLKRPKQGGQILGITEGYSTGATIAELLEIPVLVAFSCENVSSVVKAISFFFRCSSIVVFADNDRHLPHNIGLLEAESARQLDPARITIALPEFGEIPPSRDATDWNDLLRLRGREETLLQLYGCLQKRDMLSSNVDGRLA